MVLDRRSTGARFARSPHKGSARQAPSKSGAASRGKPAAKPPAKPAPARSTKPAPARGARPAPNAAAKPAPKPAPRPSSGRPAPSKPSPQPERLALRQMGRGRKPANLPETPALPPPPPSAPDFKGAAPTMHYGEAPVPPKKKTRTVAPRSTAARAAEAARAAVWAVSSPKTTAQIEAAENAFEVALSEHKATAERIESGEPEPVPPPAEAPKGRGRGRRGKKVEEPAPEPPPPPRPAPLSRDKDPWTFFRDELVRPDDADDPHQAWRSETGRPRHEMFLPARESLLAQVEAELKVKLPPSYRDFNLSWGGGRLFTQEWREVRLVGALDIPRELKERLCERMHSPYLPLADLGEGDYLAFDLSRANVRGEAPVVWWYGGHSKKKVASGFADWLEQFVASKGEAYWWEEA